MNRGMGEVIVGRGDESLNFRGQTRKSNPKTKGNNAPSDPKSNVHKDPRHDLR